MTLVAPFWAEGRIGANILRDEFICGAPEIAKRPVLLEQNQ